MSTISGEDDAKFGFSRGEMYKANLAGTVDSYDRHVFLSYKGPDSWLPRVEESEVDPLPKLLSSAIKARKNDITVKVPWLSYLGVAFVFLAFFFLICELIDLNCFYFIDKGYDMWRRRREWWRCVDFPRNDQIQVSYGLFKFDFSLLESSFLKLLCSYNLK